MRISINTKTNQQEFNEIGKQIAKEAFFRSMVKLQELARLKVPVHTGDLRRSITLRPKQPGEKTYLVFSNLHYASSVEYGTGPQEISGEQIKNLKQWSRRKLGDESATWPIIHKLRTQGQEAHPYMRPALSQVKNQEIRKIVKNVRREYETFR